MTNLAQRFDPDDIIDLAIDTAGSGDFGTAHGWSDGFELLCDGLVNEARLSPLGAEIAHADLVRALVNRLQIVAWRKAHPDVAEQQIQQPVFIVGQPRTGTTILYDLLSQDPGLRAPLTWEVDAPCPPPQPGSYHNDPRIAITQNNIELSEQIIPGFLAFTRWARRSARSVCG